MKLAWHDGGVRFKSLFRRREDWLLKANSEMAKDGILNWTLPAWVVKLPDGRNFNACPQAGACAKVCYARNGTYLFPAVRAAHMRNLEMVLGDLEGWLRRMTWEVRRRDPRAVRVHDSGDFFSDEYLLAWFAVAEECPRTRFYAYTKEVTRFRRCGGAAPRNFRWLYSLGGREDHLIDRDTERHADVFPDADTMSAAGYADQSENDLLAIELPTTRVGIPANNIPAFRKAMDGRSFGQLQEERDESRAAKADRQATR